MSPKDLIDKLLFRYNKFSGTPDIRQKAAKNAFALLVRVVDDLWSVDSLVDSSFLNEVYCVVSSYASRGRLVVSLFFS